MSDNSKENQGQVNKSGNKTRFYFKKNNEKWTQEKNQYLKKIVLKTY